jgi:hypothetical protein
VDEKERAADSSSGMGRVGVGRETVMLNPCHAATRLADTVVLFGGKPLVTGCAIRDSNSEPAD